MKTPVQDEPRRNWCKKWTGIQWRIKTVKQGADAIDLQLYQHRRHN